MKVDELPLLELFTRLRQAGLPLGLSEYQSMLEALRSGFGIQDRESLARVCQTMWVKSEEDQLLFNYHFDAIMAEEQIHFAPELQLEKDLTSAEPEIAGGSAASWLQKISSTTWLTLGGTLALVAGAGFWFLKPERPCPYFASIPQRFVERGENYRYEIQVKACDGSSVEDLEVTALRKHPWLELQKEDSGSWVLSGKAPNHDIRYSNSYLLDNQGRQVADFDSSSNIKEIQTSENGELIATLSFGQTLQRWNSQGEKISDSQKFSDVKSFRLVGNNGSFITLSSEGLAKLWSIEGKLLANLGPVSGLYKIQLINNGSLFVVLPSDESASKKAQLWSSQGQQISELGEIAQVFSGTRTNPNKENVNSEVFATLSPGNIATLWDLSGEEIADLGKVNRGQYWEKIEFSPDNRLLIAWANKEAKLWNFRGQKLAELGKISNRHSSAIFSDDSQLLVTRSSNGSSRLWNSQGRKLAELGKISHRHYSSVEFSDDSQLLITHLSNGIAKLWNSQGQEVANFGKTKRIDFSEDSRIVYSISPKSTAALWSHEGEKITNFDELKGIKTIQLNSNTNRVFIHLSDKTAQLWDFQDRQISDFSNVKINHGFFNTGSNLIVTHLKDETARLWNSQGEQVSDFDALAEIDNVRASGHERAEIITTLKKGERILWDERGQRITNFSGLKDIEVTRSEGSGFVVTLSSDRRARVWNSQGSQVNVIHGVDDIHDMYRYQWSEKYSNVLSFSSVGNRTSHILSRIDSKIDLVVTDNVADRSSKQLFKLSSFSDSSAFDQWQLKWLTRFSYVSISLAVLGLPSLYFAVRWWVRRNEKLADFPGLTDGNPESTPTAISSLNRGIEDELQVAQAISQASNQNAEIPYKELAASKYLPVTSRQMKQSWRYLRRLVREGAAVELDVQATVAQASNGGVFFEPVLRPRRVNRNELLLLVDQDGSMVPFHALSERLVQTAVHGGRLSNSGVYYFHNCPTDYLYEDRFHQNAKPISEILSILHPDYTGLLILSDAGAARGALNPERLKLTIKFLDQLQQRLRYIAWLNPMPSDRWTGTASEIAKLVPMFEVNRQGLNRAIDVLRGKSVH